MKVEFHPSTTADLNEAVRYYNKQQPGLGNTLRTEVYAAIEFIQQNPEIYVAAKGVRRALVKRFPYSVIYKLIPDQCVRVLLIRHHKRHPEHGFRRQ